VLWKSHIPDVNVSQLAKKVSSSCDSPPQFNQNSLHGKVPLPLDEAGQFGGINLREP